MHEPAVIEALNRIETEFAAMPGLRALTRSGFLQVSGDSFLRLGRRQQRRAVVA